SLINLGSVSNSFNELDNVQLRLQNLASDMRFYDAVLTDAVRAIIIDPSDKAAYDTYNRTADALDQALKEAKALATSDVDVQIFDSVSKANDRLVEIEKELMTTPDIQKAVTYYRGEYGTLKATYAGQLAQFFQRQNTAQKAQTQAIYNQIVLIQAIGIGLAVTLVIISLIVALVISRNISVPLSVLAKATQLVSQGDLTQRVTVNNRDEIGELAKTFNLMTQNLQTTMASQVAKEYLEKVINQYRAVIAQVASGDLTTRLELSGNGHQNQTGDDLYQL